jgi:hypothetical protein
MRPYEDAQNVRNASQTGTKNIRAGRIPPVIQQGKLTKNLFKHPHHELPHHGLFTRPAVSQRLAP